MKKQGVEDPVSDCLNSFRSSISYKEDGSRVISIDSSSFKPIDKKKRDAWLARREQYVAQRLFEDFGYVTMLQYRGDKVNKEDFFPCEGADGQCHFDCLMRGNCKYRE